MRFCSSCLRNYFIRLVGLALAFISAWKVHCNISLVQFPNWPVISGLHPVASNWLFKLTLAWLNVDLNQSKILLHVNMTNVCSASSSNKVNCIGVEWRIVQQCICAFFCTIYNCNDKSQCLKYLITCNPPRVANKFFTMTDRLPIKGVKLRMK